MTSEKIGPARKCRKPLQTKDLRRIFRANAEGEEPSEIRPTVLLDLKFNGVTYKDVEVGLDSRPRAHSDLLINREVMRRMNISVNPNRTFVLSKRIRPVEKSLDKSDKEWYIK